MRRRAIAAARDRHSRVAGEAEAFRGVLAAAASLYGDLGVQVPAAAAGRAREAADWEQAATALSTALSGAKRQLDRAVAEARTRTLAADGARVRAVFADNPAPARPARGTARQTAATEAPASAQADQAKLAEILGRLPVGSPPALTARCEQLASVYLGTSDPGERTRVLDGIRFQVQTARDREALIERNGKAVEALYQQLDGLRGDDVDTARGVLKGLDRSAELPGDLRERVAAAKASAEAERDREFVLAAAAKALGELGYTVGDDFRTAVPGKGAVLDLPHSGQHGVQVRERNQRLQLNVVRFDAAGAGGRRADHDAEEAFCHDFDLLKERMREDGVDLTMLRADPPGRTPVQVIAGAPRAVAEDTHQVTRPAQAQRERRREQ